jgi:alpha-L-fucosidase 2
VIKLSASESGKHTFVAGFEGELQKSAKALDTHTLELTGLSSDHEGVTGKVKFDARAKILNTGGTCTSNDSSIQVSNADEVLILISIATNFVDYQCLAADEVIKCINYLANAESKSFTTLLDDHIKSYQKYFNRVQFDLGSSPAANFPTDVRIKNFSESYDPALISMYFQFGRYLLISSSQPGGQAANLQGIWNGSVSPAWDSKYTININTEMNYWPAEKCNLPEMHEPLIQLVKELSVSGKETAKTMYGCDGWVAHHNTDIWRITGVIDFANAGL